MPMIPAAFAAVAAGTATVAAVATVVSTVGMGLSVVGKITGDETLMKIGGIMGLAGGVTSLASGALSAAESIGTAAAESGVPEAISGAASAGEGAISSVPDAITGFTNGQATAGLGAADTASAGLDAVQPFNAAKDSAAYDATKGLFNSGNPNDIASAQTTAATNNGGFDFKVNPNDIGGVAPPPDATSGGIKQWWNGLDDRTKNTVIQAGGKAIGGLFDGWTQEQKMAFEREQFNLKNSNANAQPSISYKPVKTGGLFSATKAT